MRESVRRHTENCLRLEIQALIEQKKIENAISHYQEINDQFQFARDLRLAARKYLSDPETGELTLIPRSDEVEVIYEEFVTKGADKGYVKEREYLDVLLDKIEGDIHVTKTSIKHVDIRSYALDAIKTVDVVLDKFARVEGLYEKDNAQKNPQQKPRTDDELARFLFAFLVERFITGKMKPQEIETRRAKIIARVEKEFPMANVKLLGGGSSYSSLEKKDERLEY